MGLLPTRGGSRAYPRVGHVGRRPGVRWGEQEDGHDAPLQGVHPAVVTGAPASQVGFAPRAGARRRRLGGPDTGVKVPSLEAQPPGGGCVNKAQGEQAWEAAHALDPEGALGSRRAREEQRSRRNRGTP